MSEGPQVIITRKDAGPCPELSGANFRRRRPGKINRTERAYLSEHPSRHAPDIAILKL